MLVLMCQAGENRYAIDAEAVVEVLPYVNFDERAGAPPWLAGAFAHRGTATPLLDFTQLLTGRPCPRRWNSRILLVRCDAKDMPDKIGLLAERVTTAEIDDPMPHAPSSDMEALGPILLDDQGMFQLVDVSRFLSTKRSAAAQTVLDKGDV